MSKTPRYPNPEFWRCKDHIDWKAQGENLKEVFGIFKDMYKEADKKAFFDNQVRKIKDDGQRIKKEVADVKAMSTTEKIDLVINGEKHLGKLYRKGDMCTVRREWRGIKDTAYDFKEWLKLWGMLLVSFSHDLIPAVNGLFYYRWYVSYFNCHGFADKLLMGLRGTNLRLTHMGISCVFRYVAENLTLEEKCNKKNGNSTELNDRCVIFDEMTMGQIMGGFPTLYGLPHQLLGVFLVSELDQLTCVPYIDAVESFGLPSDTCPVPTSECGALVIDALPHMGKCYLSSSMPCDGSTMASSYFGRRFPDMPVFHLCFPVRYTDEETVQMGAEDIRSCIKFIEDNTGAKWDWDSYFSQIKRFNEETCLELQKWEINKTDYPQFIGPMYELFRKWNYEMDGGADPRVLKTMQKMNKMMLKAYDRKEEAYPGKMRYRALVWSCPAHYYANFSNWAANCWGINVLVEMESLNFTKMLETEDKEEALRDMARLYERMVMRRHTNGGYQNVVDELWHQCADWNAKLVIMYQHVACKNMATVQGILDEQARELGIDLIWVEHDLMDPRTVSRRSMRDKVSEFMRTVYHAEPIDESLVDFEDEVSM